MEMKFSDTFVGLQLNRELEQLMWDVKVTKLSSNSAKEYLNVYISCEKIIPKHFLLDLERIIAKKVFPKDLNKVSIIEKFHLPEDYPVKKIYDEYKDSMELELRMKNPLLLGMFHSGHFTFSGQDIVFIVSDNVISKEMETPFLEYLDKVFCERFERTCKIDVHYTAIDVELRNQMQEIELKERVDKIILERNERLEQAGGSVKEGESSESSYLHGEKQSSGEKKSFDEKGKFYKTKDDSKEGKKERQPIIRSTNPDVVFGRDFTEEAMKIVDIDSQCKEVVVCGKVVFIDSRDIKNEKTIIIFHITDFTDTIAVKMFVATEDVPEVFNGLKKDAFYEVKAMVAFDTYDNELTLSSVRGIKKSKDTRVARMDDAEVKRVELHCHTKMSDMDAVADPKAVIKRAKAWGHRAVAITDHGNVQGFTEAFHEIQEMKDDDKPQVLYGLEGYLVDDTKGIAANVKGQTLDDTYIVFDLETTGLSAAHDKIIEIGAVKVTNGVVVDRFSTFVNPQTVIPPNIEELTSISNSMVSDAPTIEEVLPKFMEFCKDAAMVAHNAEFDIGFIEVWCKKLGFPTDFTVLDTIAMARVLIPSIGKYKLDQVAKALKIELGHHHRAVDDAACTALIFIRFCEMLKEMNIYDLEGLNVLSNESVDAVKKLQPYHVILIAANETGRINLYRLVSKSNLTYFYRFPKIPKSEILKHREGLIIGSACESGELYQAILRQQSDKEIARIVNFYDYLEIQPLANNEFMIRGEDPLLDSEDDLIEINKTIVKLGEDFDKPVVATCDAHFLDPEDVIYRDILLAGKGISDGNTMLYFRTTQEMLEEFSYLGEEKAFEVVVANTNKIADMCEYIEPVRPDKCPPVIEDSDKTLRSICYEKATSMYGDPLPPVVVERLERELKSIITNGFAVMYIIAQKLVWKSNEDGYLVGSRGSVGSSFVATMAGITEVNPLHPHYYCAKCHYSDFDSEEVKQYSGRAGCDMPDKVCPVCGENLKKDGFDIPFETFLGFKGNKEPDIDLNFSGDYQSKAHKYTEVIFGEGQTFRAGTIGTMAEKTAYGFVKKYYEEKGMTKRGCEMERLAQGCVGVRRTTGQHPGGIIVLPLGEEINTFTPVQHPANDASTGIITTHFDYHSIDHNLLKLDILGHDDPTIIRMLEDLTGIDAKTIPLDDPKVMSLFRSTEALGIKPEDINDCQLGCLGVPEFGTDFVIQMLLDTKPQSFSDLVRISGLSHGTDVWLGNAQTLIEEGKATISTAICTRDDIMTYLINMGMDSELSFTIMESVRKGKGLKPEWEEAMLANNVPDWYIWSCKKIKYMFPKAHAAAYVMMAWRIAYCKVYYPLAYYAAYFSIRASAFSYELMCQGPEKLDFYYKQLLAQETKSKKDEDIIKDMRSVQEMYARGFFFHKLDLFKADAKRFQIIDGKLMPPLSSIDGLGEVAAEALVEAAKGGPFLSKDDLKQRAKISTTVIDLMSDLGIIDLPSTNQLSLFDF